ncbi:hypothetical protein BAUCODRAFT_35203 [Baudoinia panamericana UAMH 10762]|uniref:Carboxylic ester hydrolase n=1 Tax=Baudoinia panamericana (strain UAMH 10762) TaxID=717646 RepID=M2MF13_BAUPA|nr:uncharacterized protein BAUCODRAFT_35203 [Baudoinia panamericana UAMH 10762]EMC95206.1 hypothetical protein BAUCODRAFT_35203 [Baudoinia panamericana UAMH 10762]
MKPYTSVACLLASSVTALVLPYSTPNCSTFGSSASLRQYNATFLNATHYGPRGVNASGLLNTVSFCEVYASVAYGPYGNDSLVFAVWLPEYVQYENRFMAVGNGGMAGTIDYLNMITQLNSGLGFAVAGGNGGHLASANNGGGGAPGVYIPYLHDQAQVTAWIHDAISLFTPAAKALVNSYYGQNARYAYYDGCSTGGAQGFALAQYHPDLFDGIVASSPGNWYSHLALSFLWNAQQTNTSATNLTQPILNFTKQAVLNACDTLDGVQDQLLEDPLSCKFDINSLACNGSVPAASSSGVINCLTSTQLSAVKAIYAGPVRSDNGSQLYPGFSFGSENEWLYQEGLLSNAFSVPILQNLVFNNLQYNSNTFNWASDVGLLDARAGTLIDEISLNLTAFRSHGKMLTTQGWADQYNAATWPIEHLEQLETFFGGDVSDFYELFMVPGGGHCGGAADYASVPATYHTVPALVAWVERGFKPFSLLSTNPPDGSNRTRKLCAWPSTARYVQGNVSDWTSYVCE